MKVRYWPVVLGDALVTCVSVVLAAALGVGRTDLTLLVPFFVAAVVLRPVSLAVAGGAMLYIVFVNMLPESKYIYRGRFSSIGSIAGMISGIIVSVKLG